MVGAWWMHGGLNLPQRQTGRHCFVMIINHFCFVNILLSVAYRCERILCDSNVIYGNPLV